MSTKNDNYCILQSTLCTNFSDHKVIITTKHLVHKALATHSTTPVSICSGGGSTTLIVLVDGGGGGVSVGGIVGDSSGAKILEYNLIFIFCYK